MPAPVVSLLIPTFAAEGFIDRTLSLARAQTHVDISILVSVDQCQDGTAERALAHAAADDRVSVFVQEQRLGWAGNVNFLLDRAATPFHFVYFHDDILDPAYTETLLAALRASPDAGSAHCDMGHFGGSDAVALGRAYDGAVARRLMTFMLAPYRGAPLRSLMRAEMVGGLRLPHAENGGIWANEPFLMQLIAAAPAVHVPRTLYTRWDKRSGGLTDGWRALPAEHMFASHKANVARAVAIIDAADVSAEERRALTFAAYLWVLPQVRALEHAAPLFSAPEQLHPRFAALDAPDVSALFGAEIADWAATRWRDAQADLERRRA